MKMHVTGYLALFITLSPFAMGNSPDSVSPVFQDGEVLRYKVKWVGTEPIETGVKVKSSARSVKKKRQPPVSIDYSMSPAGDEWKVFDIFTDEVSLVKNYKRQFRRVIREEGWDGLIGRMEKKLHQEEDDLL